jgi:TRAP-type C4-dicarboxylate transport system permease small subunit
LLQVETVCAVLILSVLITVISAQVFLRYVFNNPFTWAEELGALLLIYLSFVTGDVVYKKNAHISIDYVVGFFPPQLRAATQIALAAMICVCLTSLMVVSLPLIHDQFGFTIAAALPLSKSWWTMPVPIVFFSMILTTVNVIIHQAKELRG